MQDDEQQRGRLSGACTSFLYDLLEFNTKINLYSRKDNSDIFVVYIEVHLYTIKYNDLFDMITYLCPYMQDKLYQHAM